MKALVSNLAKAAAISSLYETLTYPADNVADPFLDIPFVSILATDTLTIDLGANTPIDCLFIAGCNASSVDILIQNAALATVYSATKAIDGDVVSVYPGPLTARYVKITGTAAAYFKIKGVGVGLIEDFGDVRYGFAFPSTNDTARTRSVTGQVQANRAPTLKRMEVQIPIRQEEGGRDRVQELLDLLDSIGIGSPAYWDITSDDNTFEAPIYAEIPEVWQPEDKGTYYQLTMTLLEAR